MMMTFRRGFTLVELAIVVVVIGILAGIVTVNFNNVQSDARDAKIKSGAQKIAEAIELWSLKTQLQPVNIGVGYGSSGVLLNENGIQRCSVTQGSAGSGWFGVGSYACTMEEALTQMGFLEEGYVNTLPVNTKYNTSRTTYMLYRCNNIAYHWLLLYTLEKPTQKDIQTYDDVVVSKCGNGITYRNSYNMQSAILIDLSKV